MRRVVAAVILLILPLLFGRCAIIEMTPNPLGPLTGRWEGTGTYQTGPGAPKEFTFALTLVEANGKLAGSGDIGDGVVALQGVSVDNQITLDAEVLGDAIQLRGEVTGDSIQGTVHFRGTVGTWEVTRVE